MDQSRAVVATDEAAGAGDQAVPFEYASAALPPESPDEAQAQGPEAEALFWSRQIAAALVHERRFRTEAIHCERLYFGEDTDAGPASSTNAKGLDKIGEETALIHGNIDVLKPMLFSETPQPVVRRRWRGDGRFDETDAMAAEAAQRLATYMLDTEDFDGAMAAARDDWLIVGRGSARVIYKAAFGLRPDPATGQPTEAKTSERVVPRHSEWQRTLYAPASTWEDLPWQAFEVPMTRTKIEKRFPDHAARFSYSATGITDRGRAISDEDRDTGGFRSAVPATDESGAPVASPFDTANVWEIWSKETRETLWWSPACPGVILDKQPDPLHLEQFYPAPAPLMATRRTASMTPRSDIRYYEMHAREISIATEKLRSILKVISISGLVPAESTEDVKKLLSGENTIIPIASWLKFLESGGSNNLIQWLPLQHLVAAAQALVQMRESNKQAMFEASGVSDLMRAQGDPSETATAQNLKGRYAGLRLSERQRRMAIFALDTLRLMVEIAFEHFDTQTIADITGLDLPLTEAERQAEIQRQEQIKATYQQAADLNAAAEQEGVQVQPLPPMPDLPDIAKTSWELVHDRLRSDFKRKITLSIETQSTILADETTDKDARIEFLQAFSGLTQQLMPLATSGAIEMKTVKELLMFGIRGFPKSRILESHISDLPDELPEQGPPPEEVQVTVAKIRAEVDVQIKEMDMADNEAARAHELRLKGVDVIADAVTKGTEPIAPPTPPAAEGA